MNELTDYLYTALVEIEIDSDRSIETRIEDKDRILIGLIFWESSPGGKRGHLARGVLPTLGENDA